MSVEISSEAPFLSSSSYYLDKPIAKFPTPGEAKPKNGSQDKNFSVLSSCGKWASKGVCESGHRHSRTIDCGREWCPNPDCRTRSQMRRVSRWLPKAFKMGWMGYWVITFPPYMREEMKCGLKKNLVEIRNTIEALFQSLGFDVGLYRWHYASERQPGLWNPHFNNFTESGYLGDGDDEGEGNDDNFLELVKDLIREALGLPDYSDIHYSYTKSIRTKLKNLKYVCRPTFLDRAMGYDLADQLFNFKNAGSWGSKKCLTGEWRTDKRGRRVPCYRMSWPGDDKWILPRREKLLGYHAKVVNSICPLCNKKITWGGVVQTDDLIDQGFERIWNGIYTERPPPGDLKADEKFCGQLMKFKLFSSLKGRPMGESS